MGYTERHCYLCGGGFNIARLRRIDEPIAMAWHGCHGYYRPSANDPVEEIEDARMPAEDGGIAHVLRDWIEGEGISTGSDCYRAGCSEADGDHAAGSLECANRDGYNGWKISAEEMEVSSLSSVRMFCHFSLLTVLDHDVRTVYSTEAGQLDCRRG